MSIWDWHVALVAVETERFRAKERWELAIACIKKGST
jgi:hypothetical protein